jgi:hypothetical protein
MFCRSLATGLYHAAIMAYNSIDPKESIFFLLRVFAEWVAILYANKNNILFGNRFAGINKFTLRSESSNEEQDNNEH